MYKKYNQSMKNKYRKRKYVVITITILIILVISACGNRDDSKNKGNISQENGQAQDMENKANYDNNLEITTVYLPVSTLISENVIIVKKSEEVDLYGIVDNDGNVVVEPQYDSMEFVKMGGDSYIRARLEGKTGILNLDGSIKVPCEYNKIVSAGNIGWLALLDKTQMLLSGDGALIKSLQRVYDTVLFDKYLYGNGNLISDAGGNLSRLEETVSIYDLDENVINEELEGLYMEAIEYNDLFVRYNPGLEIVDVNENIIAQIGTGNDGVSHVDNEKHTIIVHISDKKSQGCGDNYLSKGLESGDYEFSIDTLQFVSLPNYSPNGYRTEKNGDLYRVYDNQGNDIFGERFHDVNLFSNGSILIENIDGEMALASVEGEILIPFGELKRENDHNTYYLDKKILDILDDRSDEGYCGFYIQNEDTSYTIYAYKY